MKFYKWHAKFIACDVFLVVNREEFIGMTEFFHQNTFVNHAASSIDKPKSPYQELRNLIGLVSVKQLTNQIIASTVMDKKRSAINGHNACSSKHMIFTGEPGSAKTTVARLLAGALKEKGALETGAFVECGRQDLVGKYTGWTALRLLKNSKKPKVEFFSLMKPIPWLVRMILGLRLLIQ